MCYGTMLVFYKSGSNSNNVRAKITNFYVLSSALCRFCEPIAFMSIFPYIYYMILDFNITSDDRQIAMYAGMITSAFAFAEFSTGVIWGKLSDKIGRKPVLITGLAGTGFSMLLFGFAPSLPVALLGRALGGFLNGCGFLREISSAKRERVSNTRPEIWGSCRLQWPSLSQ